MLKSVYREETGLQTFEMPKERYMVKGKKKASGKWIRAFSAICVLMFSAVDCPIKATKETDNTPLSRNVTVLLPKAQCLSLPSKFKLVAACWHPQVL